MASQWWSDDEQLLAALDEALCAVRDVPREFIEAGKAAYAWHNIDAELAALTYDSELHDSEAAMSTRAEPAPLRALTFASPRLSIELEIADDALHGQLVPPQAGEVEVSRATGRAVTAAIDVVGYFVIRPIPSGSFRLCCRTVGGITVTTRWITP